MDKNTIQLLKLGDFGPLGGFKGIFLFSKNKKGFFTLEIHK